MMAFALISIADNAWLGTVDEALDPLPDGARLELLPINWPASCEWSPSRGGFVDIVTTSPLITIGRFKLLFTHDERLALHAAASSSPAVFDYLDLLNGFTEGIALDDPFLTAGIGGLVSAGLLNADRAATILAGTPPISGDPT